MQFSELFRRITKLIHSGSLLLALCSSIESPVAVRISITHRNDVRNHLLEDDFTLARLKLRVYRHRLKLLSILRMCDYLRLVSPAENYATAERTRMDFFFALLFWQAVENSRGTRF